MMFTQWLNIERDSKKNEYVEMVRNSQWFDDRWYASQYDDVYKKLIDPARHYCYTGWKENRNPCADFKTADYLRKYPECGVCPLIFEQNRNSKVDLAVCVIVKDEAPYIKEWLDYHLMLGVKRFYVYDNESSDNLRQVIMPYVRQGIVVYKYYPGEARQVPAYNECIKEYSDKVHWMAFVDADEFIVPVEKDNIPDFLADYENYPGVGINWIMFDSNGHKKRPHGGVLENYTRVQYDDNCLTNHHIKSIVKPSEVLRFINPHYCEYKDDSKYTVDVSKRYITGEGTERSFTPFVLIDKIRINHYYSKSKEEADIKSIRGMATSKYGKLKLVKESEINFADYKYDYSVSKYVVKMKPSVIDFEMLKLAWLGLKNICIKIKHKFHHDLLDNYFDEDWYLLQYPDVKNSGMSAKEHYFTVGWKLGYNPSDKFDTKFYLEKYQDVARAGLNPVLHYFAFGQKEGRLPAPDFIPSLSKNEKKNAEKSFLARLNSWGNTLFAKKKSGVINTKYVANPFGYITDRIFLSDKELKAPKYHDAILLPIKSRNDGSIWYMGGVLDAEGNYIQETALKSEVCYNNYKIEGDVSYIDEDVVYIGFYWDHYGHFIIEQFARLWYFIKGNNKKLKLCYSMANGMPLPGYIKQLFNILGITEQNSIKITEPTRFRSIIIPEMSTSASNWYTKEYKLIYDTIRSRVMPVYNDKVYLSRTHFEKSKEYEFGEWYIEKLFAANGYKIVYPEELSFAEQLSIIKGAQTVACISGSLLHQMLFARDGTELIVLQQFSGINSAQRLVNEMRRLKVTYIDCFVNLPYVKQGVGPYLLVNNNSLQNYAKDNRFKTVDIDEERVRQDFYSYISKWQEYAENNKLIRNISKEEQDRKIMYFKQKYMTENGFNFDIESIDQTYFDEEWYISRYPEVIKSELSPIEHYFFEGWKKGYNPSSNFDTDFYLNKYPDIKKAGINPLSHFITYGMNEGRLPLPNVDDILTEHNKENAEFQTDTGKVEVSETPVEGEVKNMVNPNVSENADIVSGIGDTERQSPEDFSIPEIREDENDKAWWRRIFINRRLEGKTKEYIAVYKSRLFDEKWYLAQYPEVENSGIDPVEHYLTIGWEKGYNPSKKFNTKWYLIKYRDVREAKVNPLSHYILHGKQEGREIFPVHVSSESKLSSGSPMISVIVPIYNCEDTISETLDALIKQTYKNFEVIVVDDGSEDGSVNIVKKYVKKYPFILLHRHKHGATQGMPETIRLGIQKAKGEYIAFCESGDYWQPNCLQKRVDIINSYSDVNIVSNGVELFGNEEFRFQYKKYVDETDYLLEDGENHLDLNVIGKFNCIPTFSCVMIKKNIFEKLNFASPLSKWFDFWLYRQVLAKFPLYYTHEKLVKWHMNKNFYDTLKATIDAEDSDYFIIKSNKLTEIKGFKCTNYDIVKKSKYWDEKYYLKHYKDDLDDLDAISHYICIGWKKGCNPSAGFDNNAYIKAYHDISKAHINPLIHYEICGFKEKRKVYPVNDADKK